MFMFYGHQNGEAVGVSALDLFLVFIHTSCSDSSNIINNLNLLKLKYRLIFKETGFIHCDPR